MRGTITEQLLQDHVLTGTLKKGEEIGLTIDQTLTQDATGTMVYLEFESLGIDRVTPEVAVSYIDHNIVQSDFKNADDHRFLQSSASKYGVKLSPPGNGVSPSPPLRQEAEDAPSSEPKAPPDTGGRGNEKYSRYRPP